MNEQRRSPRGIAASTTLASAAVVLCLFLGTPSLHAQGVDLDLENLGIPDLAHGYLRPGADALGFAINSGLTRGARVEKGFHLSLGVRGVWTFIPGSDRTFTAVLPRELTLRGYPAEVVTATIVGGKGTTMPSKDPSLPDITMPSGVDAQSVVMAIPHITIGSIAGTELILRGVPNMRVDDIIGDVSFFGGGLKNNFSSFTKKPFIDLAVLAMYQYMEVDGDFTQQTFNISLQASKTWSRFTAFASFGYEGYDIAVAYDYEPILAPPTGVELPDRIHLDFEGRNLRASLGGAVQLLSVLSVMADYSFGVQDNFVAGLDFTF